MPKKVISDRNFKKGAGLALKGDYENAAKYFRKAAEDGHADAQYGLGTFYLIGNGVAQNTEEAWRWFSKAAGQGHAEAKEELDWIKKLKEHTKEGIQQVEDPEEQDEVEDPEEQDALGMAYLNGEGVEQDDEEAVKWFRKAAEQGYPIAEFHLGMRYYDGRGVEKNLTDAFKWISEALEQGIESSKAQSILGQAYFFGEGTAQNFTEAVKWLRKASYIITSEEEEAINIESLKKDGDAQFYMGWCYLTGNGVTKNIKNASHMFIAAASRNENHSLRVLKSIRQEGNSLENIRISIIRIHTKDGWNETMMIHPDGKSEVKLVMDGLESPPDNTKTTGK